MSWRVQTSRAAIAAAHVLLVVALAPTLHAQAPGTAPAGESAQTPPANSGATTSDNSIYDEDPAATVAPRIPDKIEGFNRAMFKFNDGAYHYVLRPIAHGYATVVPSPIRHGFGHFFHNLAFPTRFVGNVLEGRFSDAGVETGRFVVNTVTSLGFAATADHIHGMQERPSDLGLAFGTWGIGHGTYLVLPILGPSSVRDGVGLGLSGYFLDPIYYIPKWKVRTGAEVFQVVNESPDLMDQYDALKAGAIDPYVALRDAYSSRRAHRISNDTQTPVIPAATGAVAPKP
ncbi:MAG TPA: VacJ family lipoprotein [Opitutaceae bacterium]